ncbi:hypothetical protein GOV10_02680 [Candidatus Woesearchaeota archaeon]|nr:hypothetical protein [Candidatus Woesearchaeota archaeon]
MKNRTITLLLIIPLLVATASFLVGKYLSPNLKLFGATDWYYAPIFLVVLFFTLLMVPILFVQVKKKYVEDSNIWKLMLGEILLIQLAVIWATLNCMDLWFFPPIMVFFISGVWNVISVWRSKENRKLLYALLVFVGSISIIYLVLLGYVFFGPLCRIS